MAYIGRAPTNGFHAKQTLTGDGSTVTFTLNQTVAHETSIIVSVGGVIQEPNVAYNLAGGGSQITFTAAPASTNTIYVQFLGTAIVQNINDLNGAEFVLDADADTSFTADTDDEIDIKIAGSDKSTIKATGFHNVDSFKFIAGTGDDLQLYHDGTNSYLANSTGALKVATETSGIAVTIGHTTSEVTFGDNVTVTGNLTVGGSTSFGDFNITNVGSIALDTITNDGTDITLDSSGDIILDSDGADVIFKDAGTEISRFTNSSSDFVIQTAVSDKDFVIKGNDGGSTITPLTLDMSAGGDLFLTGGLIDLKNDGSAVSQIKFYCESSNAHAQTLIGAPHSESATNTLTLPSTGGDSYLVTAASTATLTNKTLTTPIIAEIDSGSTITLDATTDIVLDADGGDIFFKDGGTTFGSATNTSGNLIIKSGTTTAATFSGANVTLAGTVGSGAITSTGIVTGTGFTAGNAVLAEAELELLDGLTAGTAIASKVVTTDANIDTTGQRNLTITGELDAATLDISGDVDVDGTTNLDVVDIDGAVDMASTLQVDGAITSSDGMTITTADNSETLILKSTDADANVGPLLVLRRDSSSPADNDLLGEIQMEVENSNGSKLDAVTLTGKVLDVTAGTVDGSLAINVISGSTLTEFAKFEGSVGSTFSQPVSITSALTQDGGAVFNEAGADADFRIESASNSGMFFVNAGASRVSVGTDGNFDAVFNVSGETVMRTSGNSDTLTLKCTDADANEGPILVLTRDSSSPADDDILGRIKFQADDDGGNVTNFLTIDTRMTDASDGSEDFKTIFAGMVAGSEKHVFTLGSTEAVFNDGSVDIDFRVESNTNTHAIFVEGSSSHIGINTSSPQSDLHVTGSDTSTSVIIENTNADASAAPDLFLFRNSSSPADDDSLGNIEFRGKNDNTEDTRYVINNAKALDVTDGTEDGQIEWQLLNAGSFQKILTMNPTEVVFNEDSGSTDFRVESNGNDSLFFVDGANDHISIGGNSDAGGLLNVFGKVIFKASDNSDNLELLTTDADANSGPNLRMYRNSSSPADSDLMGSIQFEGRNDNSQDVVYGEISAKANDVSDGTEDGEIIISSISAGTSKSRIEIQAGGTVFNEDSADIDFRVESNGQVSAFLIDAGNDTSTFNVPVTFNNGAANVTQEALTSSSNAVAWDATDKPNAFHLTTENTTFSAPSNAVEGAFICLEINYNGSHTIAFNTVFEFAASTAPTTTDTDGKTDILVFRYNGAVWQEVGRTLNLSES